MPVDKKVAEIRARIAVHRRWGNVKEEQRARRELYGIQLERSHRRLDQLRAAAYDEPEPEDEATG